MLIRKRLKGQTVPEIRMLHGPADLHHIKEDMSMIFRLQTGSCEGARHTCLLDVGGMNGSIKWFRHSDEHLQTAQRIAFAVPCRRDWETNRGASGLFSRYGVHCRRPSRDKQRGQSRPHQSAQLIGLVSSLISPRPSPRTLFFFFAASAR